MNEVREIPKGWTKAIFEDLLDYIQPTKFIVESTEYDDKYKTPVLTAGKSFIIGHTHETNGIFNEIPVIIFDDFTTSTQFVNFQFKVKSSAMKILKPTCELVSIKYVFYFMQTIHVSVDTHKRYWISHYSQLPIPLPPLPEQQRIVAKIEELFSSLDKGIESLKTAQQQLKVYRQAVLKWAFEGKFTNENVKEGELPDGWKWKQTKEITSVLGDGLHGTPVYSESGEYYFINGNNLSDGKIEIKENTKRVTIEEYEKYKKPLNENTIFVSINGTLGNTAFYNGEKVVLGKSACYFNVLNTVDKQYVRYCITSQRFINYAHKNATGSTIKNVGLKAMREFEIPLPPTIEEQQLIVAEIESRLLVCDKIEESIEHSLKQSEALRQSILKKAFEGKLVPQDPNDEPASVLLERIKAEREQNKPETPPRRQAGKTKTIKAKS